MHRQRTTRSMTTKRLFPPTPDLTAACDKIDEAAGLLLRDVWEPFPRLGRYESDVEARVLFTGLLRHVEALLECARADLAFLPAASTIARAALEQGVKIRWLLHPPEIFDREARFLAHLSDEERMLERCARYSGVDAFRERAAKVQEFRKGVEDALPPEIARLPRIPNLDAMMAEIGEAKRYFQYTLLSQYAHGSHFGGGIYRRNLGTEKELGERVSATEWALLLQVSWWSLFSAAQTIEHVCAKRNLRSIGPKITGDIDGRLSRLRGNRDTVS
jgi:hypothetical protein